MALCSRARKEMKAERWRRVLKERVVNREKTDAVYEVSDSDGVLEKITRKTDCIQAALI